VITGIRKKCTAPEVTELQLSGTYVDDLATVQAAKKQYSAKAVDPDVSLRLVLDHIGCKGAQTNVAGLLRVANNSVTPCEALSEARKNAGRTFPFATVDARGHVLDAFRELPQLERAVFVPGQVESCVTILRNLLAQEASSSGSASSELLVRYVDTFLPRAAKQEEAQGDEEV